MPERQNHLAKAIPNQVQPLGDSDVVKGNLGNRTLMSVLMRGILDKKEHFYVLEVWNAEKGCKDQTYNLSYEGKRRVAGLAGCHISSYIEKESKTLDHMIAYGRTEWLDPMGETWVEERMREYDLPLEYEKSVTKKTKQKLMYLEKSNKARHTELCQEAWQQPSQQEGNMYLQRNLLSWDEVYSLQLAQMEIRTHLPALTQSKAESQALTAFLRTIGIASKYKEIPNGQVEFTVIRTVEVNSIQEGNAAQMLYSGANMPELEGREISVNVSADDPIDSNIIDEVMNDPSLIGEEEQTQKTAPRKEEPVTEPSGLVPILDPADPRCGVLANIDRMAVELELDLNKLRETAFCAAGKDKLEDCTMPDLVKVNTTLTKKVKLWREADKEAPSEQAPSDDQGGLNL